MRCKIVSGMLITLMIFSSLAFFGRQIEPVQAQASLVAGINYMSSGNAWGESTATLDADFARFAGNGVKHISMRIMWSVTEPTHYDDYSHLSSTAMSNYKRVLTEANKYGIKVNVDFWTQFTYTLGKPSWVGNYYDIVTSSDIKAHYLRYMKAVVTELRNYPAVESWTVLNEPFYSVNSYKAPFQTFFQESYNAIKSIDPVHIVTCRFTLSYTPGSGKYDKSVYDIFDAFAVTEYLDPSNPTDTRYNGRWSYWDNTVADLKARNKPLWVIEFGDDNSNTEHVRKHYELSLQKFQAAGIVARAYSWAWQTRSAANEAFNIYSGTTPDPAYNELTKYPDAQSQSSAPVSMLNLLIATRGSGSTDPVPGVHMYSQGNIVSVDAQPDSGYKLGYWLLNDMNAGSDKLYEVAMNASNNLTAVFLPEQYSLTVNVNGSGAVARNPNQATYLYGTNVTLTASPSPDWVFAGWSDDASGSGSVTSILMNKDKIVTATFISVSSRDLLIAAVGSGTTDPVPGTYPHLQGEVVSVDAQPSSGFKLGYWLLNGTVAGSADPYQVTLNTNLNLTAVFVPIQVPVNSIFRDSFESGSVNQWSGSSVTSGETVTVQSSSVHDGTYGAIFTANGGGGIKRAYVYENIDAKSEIYVRGYFNINSGLPLKNNNNRFNLLALMSTDSTIASLSVRHSGGADLWSITSVAGTWYASSGPVMNQWYSVEFYAKIASGNGGILRMWVDGQLVIERTGINTATVGNVNSVRSGLVYVRGVTSSLVLFSDCQVISGAYIGPE